ELLLQRGAGRCSLRGVSWIGRFEPQRLPGVFVPLLADHALNGLVDKVATGDLRLVLGEQERYDPDLVDGAPAGHGAGGVPGAEQHLDFIGRLDRSTVQADQRLELLVLAGRGFRTPLSVEPDARL